MSLERHLCMPHTRSCCPSAWLKLPTWQLHLVTADSQLAWPMIYGLHKLTQWDLRHICAFTHTSKCYMRLSSINTTGPLRLSGSSKCLEPYLSLFKRELLVSIWMTLEIGEADLWSMQKIYTNLAFRSVLHSQCYQPIKCIILWSILIPCAIFFFQG